MSVQKKRMNEWMLMPLIIECSYAKMILSGKKKYDKIDITLKVPKEFYEVLLIPEKKDAKLWKGVVTLRIVKE